jgi:hypothetical protein
MELPVDRRKLDLPISESISMSIPTRNLIRLRRNPFSISTVRFHRAFDDYFKAFSVAFLPGPERPTLAYGGKGTRI